jgi:hypothetical protein
MVIERTQLLEKLGGKSGHYQLDNATALTGKGD